MNKAVHRAESLSVSSTLNRPTKMRYIARCGIYSHALNRPPKPLESL